MMKEEQNIDLTLLPYEIAEKLPNIGGEFGKLAAMCKSHVAAFIEKEIMPRISPASAAPVVESPILAFQTWLERWVIDNGRKLTQDEYGIAYAAFIAAHPGEGPKAQVMVAPVVDNNALKKRARQIIDAVVKSPCVVEVQFFSQPEESEKLENEIAALITPAAATAAPEQSDESEYVVIDGERRRVVPCPDGRQGCEVLHTEPITNEEAR